MEKRMHIVGKGSISVKVDQIEFNISLKAIKEQYDEAYSFAQKQLESLQKDITALGFKKEEIKTTSFRVDQHYENSKDENDNYIRRMVGYQVNHDLIFKCDYDTKLLSLIIKCLSDCKAMPEFNIRFTIKDNSAAKRALLKKITNDAKRKAKIFAKANNVKLGSLVDIDYSFSDMDFYSPTVYGYSNDLAVGCNMKSSMDITAQDVTISDSASFSWEIQ